MPSPPSSTALSQGQRNVSQYTKKPAGDTPEDRLNIADQGVPHLPVQLPSGYLSRLSCGVAVVRPLDEDDIVRRSCYGKDDQPPPPVPETKPIAEISFTRCPDCARRDALATQVVTETQGLSRRFPPDSAQQWLSAALDGLAILGLGPQPIANPNPQNLTEIEAMRLIHHLRIPGGNAHWERRLVPYLTPDADPNTCSRQPRAHVKMGQRQDLRTGYAAMLRGRAAAAAPPLRLPPPILASSTPITSDQVVVSRGCLYCGLRAQVMTAERVEQLGGRQAAARAVWTIRRIAPQSLGGQPSPKILIGHLCQTCNDAAVAVGTLGPTSMERALVMALTPQGIGQLGYDNFALNGLTGWGVLSVTSQVSPSSEPWRHLGDLEELRRRLSAALHV